MISHINGKLVEKTPTYVIIDCNGIDINYIFPFKHILQYIKRIANY